VGEGSSGVSGSGEREIRLDNEQRLPDIFYLLIDWVIIWLDTELNRQLDSGVCDVRVKIVPWYFV
jgi:hypothetical protein